MTINLKELKKTLIRYDRARDLAEKALQRFLQSNSGNAHEKAHAAWMKHSEDACEMFNEMYDELTKEGY